MVHCPCISRGPVSAPGEAVSLHHPRGRRRGQVVLIQHYRRAHKYYEVHRDGQLHNSYSTRDTLKQEDISPSAVELVPGAAVCGHVSSRDRYGICSTEDSPEDGRRERGCLPLSRMLLSRFTALPARENDRNLLRCEYSVS